MVASSTIALSSPLISCLCIFSSSSNASDHSLSYNLQNLSTILVGLFISLRSVMFGLLLLSFDVISAALLSLDLFI